MRHRLFLFDLDDTLLDFQASERLSFARTLDSLGWTGTLEPLFRDYQAINAALWQRFERGEVSKDFLKTERFRQAFALHDIALDPALAGRRYLDCLPETVVLVDGARAVCEALAAIGEVGVITNGVEAVQTRRILKAGLGDAVSFVATSEACGHAKPDTRFFAYTVSMAKAFAKSSTVIIGDRLNADILGANQFGIDSCWFNPNGQANDSGPRPTYEVASLHEVEPTLRSAAAATPP